MTEKVISIEPKSKKLKELKPGEELDALVQDQVMNNETGLSDVPLFLSPDANPTVVADQFSTNISHSNRVLDALLVARGFKSSTQEIPGEEKGSPSNYACVINTVSGRHAVVASTQPLAICIAALSAVGYKS